MALNKQKISIPLFQGIDSKTDDKQLIVGTPTKLENVVFDKPGKLLKRKGYESVTLTEASGSTIENAKTLSTFKNELNLFDNTNLYSRIDSIDKWSDKGSAFTILPDSTVVLKNNVQQSNLNAIHVGGLNIHVWEDSNGIGLSIIDNDSKNFVLSNTVLSITGTNPKLVSRGSVVYITYVDNSAIKYRKFPIYDYNNITAETTIISSISATSQHYDTILVGDRIVIAYSESVASELSFIALKSDDTLTSISTVTGETPSISINLNTDAASRIVCTYYDKTDVKIIIYNYTLGVKILSETSLETITNVTNVTAIESTTDNYTIIYEISDINTYDHYIKKQTINTSGTLGTASTVINSVGLASKMFTYNSNIYFAAIHQNTLQSTYFIINTDGNIVSKISPATGGHLIASGGLSTISNFDTHKFLFTSQIKGRLVSDEDTYFSILGVNETILDFNPESIYKTTTIANNLHIAGGFLKMYDGANVVEHGFHLYPENLTVSSGSPVGGVLPVGIYNYKAVYAWTDAQGLTHRSAPSIGFETDLGFADLPTATTSGLTTEITYTSATLGPSRNTDTITIQVNAAAANPFDSVLVAVTGTSSAVVITITPNDGTNNNGTAVNLTTAELTDIITEGETANTYTTVTDASSLLTDLSATGGDATDLANGGEGDGVVATLNAGTSGAQYPTATTTDLTTNITYTSATSGPTRNEDIINLNINPAAANTADSIIVNVTGDIDNTTINITPNNGTYNGATPSGTTSGLTTDITFNSKTIGTNRNGDKITMNVYPAGSSTYPDPILLLWVSGDTSNMLFDIYPATSATFTTADLVDCFAANISNGGLGGYFVLPSGKTVAIFGPGTQPLYLMNDFYATGGDTTPMADGGEGDGIVTTLSGGTNVPVNITTAEVAELISTSAVSGLNISLTDSNSLLSDLTATGGDTTNVVAGGEGDMSSVVLNGGVDAGLTQQQTIKIPSLRLTDKENVDVELYRTEKSGTIFYKVGSTQNNKSANYVTITDDSIDDEALISQEIIYTTGGELENIPAPAGSIIENFGDRVFITTPESQKLNYSKINNEGFPIEFNDTLEIKIPPTGNNNIALKKMDDKLILFKESSIHYLSGDGPNNLGEQNTFTSIELINSEIGCINSSSVVLITDGIMFMSKKGIYLLDHSLNLSYIGAAVEEFNDLSITSAIVVPVKNQVRFTTSDGDCLLYNYVQKKWNTFTNHRALSATFLNNDYFYLRTDNILYKQTELYSDNGTFIKSKLDTGWMSFSQVQGYQRVYKMLILGQYKSDHKLRIRVAYDFNESWVQEKTISVSDFINQTSWGSASTYGADNYFGGDGTPYQIRLDFARQKCQSIKISIEDFQTTIGEGMELSNILFVVGLKSTENKINNNQQYGTGV